MEESNIIAAFFLGIGLLVLVRSDLFVAGTKYEQSRRARLFVHATGAAFFAVGLIVFFGFFDDRYPFYERKDLNNADMERIWEDIAKEDCRILDGIWENGECMIPSDISARNAEAKSKCLAAGGAWGRLGLSVKEQCNLPTKDGGKACTDSSQCEGSCFGEGVGAVSGKCSDWTINKGCHAIVTDGMASGMICED